MKLYCGIDLHSNNHYISIIDEENLRLKEKRISNDLSQTLTLLKPYKHDLQGIAIESTFNWYWLVDGLMDANYSVSLVNTCAVKQYEGLKHTDDQYDAYWLAHLMRLGILPTGYIYPKKTQPKRSAAQTHATRAMPNITCYQCAGTGLAQYRRALKESAHQERRG